ECRRIVNLLKSAHHENRLPRMNAPPDPKTVLAELWRGGGHPESALDTIELTGADPVLPSSFAVGTAAQASIAASGRAAAPRRRRGAAHARRLARRGVGDGGRESRSRAYRVPVVYGMGSARSGARDRAPAAVLDREDRRGAAAAVVRRRSPARRRPRSRSHAR